MVGELARGGSVAVAINDRWHMTCDMWQVTRYTRHVTWDKWHFSNIISLTILNLLVSVHLSAHSNWFYILHLHLLLHFTLELIYFETIHSLPIFSTFYYQIPGWVAQATWTNRQIKRKIICRLQATISNVLPWYFSTPFIFFVFTFFLLCPTFTVQYHLFYNKDHQRMMVDPMFMII